MVGIESLIAQIHPRQLPRFLNQLDINGISALHHAARYNHLEIVMLLVKHGADVNIKNDDNQTPLHFCARLSYKSFWICFGSINLVYISLLFI